MIPASKNIRKVDQIFLIIPSNYLFRMNSKVEKILKGSLDLIPSPSPSVKIQIMGGKVCLMCTGKTFLGVVNKHLDTKKFVDNAQQCFAFTHQAKFPPII